MLRVQLILALIVGCVCPSWQASSPTDSYYTAGVVEFRPASNLLTPLQQVNENLAAYLEIISSEQAAETDIIAFPEATLNNADQLSYVPDPLDNIAPCAQPEYAEFLQKLSCQARDSRKYIIINLSEKENCTDELQVVKQDPRACAQNGLTTYNTNVVFDRSGVVISRYRKVNLYYEPWNVTHRPEYGHFETDFGVHFGHFICFDILFYTPTTELVNMGITDFIFTTMWFSELPFLTAAQTQQSWAYSYDVNLLAAGASYPLLGSTGTGIYVGKNGSLVSVMSSIPERKLYVAKVPKKGFIRSDTPPPQQLQIRKRRAPNHLNGVLVKRDPGVDSFVTVPFNTSLLYSRLCHNGLCCQFTSRTTKLTPPVNTKSYQYRLAAYNGQRLYDGIQPLGWALCSIIACTDNTLESCGLTFNGSETVSPEFVLENMLIEADFANGDSALMMPNSVDDTLMPLTVGSFEFIETNKGNQKNIQYSLLTPRDNLMNFGIYVNYFFEKSSASVVYISKFLAIFTAMSIFVMYLRK